MDTLAVVACGMVTSVGFNAAATVAALRAGVSGVSGIPWIDGESGDPLSGAKVRLPQWWEGLGKFAELAAPAIHECLQAAQPEPASAIPILVGTPVRSRAGRPPEPDGDLLDELAARLGVPLHPDSQEFAADQVGCVAALLQARRLIAARLARCVVVAGVDSFLHQATLDHYAERRRLVTSGNSNGFFPGEAGTAVLVREADASLREGLVIRGIGLGMEPATIEGDAPFRGEGLTRAVAAVLKDAGVSMQDVAFRITDASGEHYKFKEAAFVALRLDDGERAEVLDLWHPNEYLGEIGSAILPCVLGWAHHAFREGYAPGPRALCHVGSDSGERAALVVESAEARRERQ